MRNETSDQIESTALLLQNTNSHTLPIICAVILDVKASQNHSNHNDFAVPINVDTEIAPTRTQLFLSKSCHVGKNAIACGLLIGRALSCTFRYVMSKNAILFFFKVPGLNQWDGAPGVIIFAESSAAFFALADTVRTIDASKKRVFDLCHQPWSEGMKCFYHHARAGRYPKLFLLCGFFSIIGSAVKGYKGSENVLQRLSTVSHLTFLQYVLPIAYFVAFSSSICFIAFQLFGQSMWVVDTFRRLEGDANWNQFKSDNKNWIRKNNFMGYATAVAGAASAGIAMTYVNDHFQFEPINLISFALIVLPSVYFNIKYSFTPVFLLESILGKGESLELKKNNISDKKNFSCSVKKTVGFFSAVGSAIAFCPAIVCPLQILFHLIALATHDDHYRSQYSSPYFYLAGDLLSFFFIYAALLQDFAMWTKSSLHAEKKLPSQSKMVSPALSV